jgi:hypothetical protein
MPLPVLNKPGKLTDAEFTLMKSHPSEGHKLLQQVGNVDPVALDVCLHHHETMDGSGYPKGLKGDEISLFAKMGAVCDVYDAITSNRPYKSGWDPAESLRKMAEWAEGHFDHRVFQAFVKSLGIYPIGSLLRLTSGRIGVVVEQTTKSRSPPMRQGVFSPPNRTCVFRPRSSICRYPAVRTRSPTGKTRKNGASTTSTSCGPAYPARTAKPARQRLRYCVVPNMFSRALSSTSGWRRSASTCTPRCTAGRAAMASNHCFRCG